MATNATSEQERSDTTNRSIDNRTEVLAHDGDGNPITQTDIEEWEQSDCRACGASDLDGYAVTDDRDGVLCYDCVGGRNNSGGNR